MFNEVLNQQIADAMCTIVAIGFMAEQSQIHDERQRTRFQYEEPEDRDLHSDLRQLIFRNTGVNVYFTQTQLVGELPLIIAKAPNTQRTEVGIITQAFNQTQAFWADMEHIAQQSESRPNGAYIGGIARPTGFTIIGPSKLLTCNPLYRVAPDEIGIAYSDMTFEIVKVSSALNKVYQDWGDEPNQALNYENYNEANADADILPPEKLFGSVHGMVRAMLRYPQLADDSLHVEYSLSPGTKKVASCIPCSIFMSAQGRPASATHLGRGDSWNFPNPNLEIYPQMEEQTERWGLTVIQHFFTGRDLLRGVMDTNPALFSLNQVEIADNIPLLFLESLTFHDSFLNRMLRTLTPR